MTHAAQCTIPAVFDGNLLIETDYWRSRMCDMGLAYVIWRAPLFHLLLPIELEHICAAADDAYEARVSAAAWGAGRALEFSFDNGSQTPAALLIHSRQVEGDWRRAFISHARKRVGLVLWSYGNVWQTRLPVKLEVAKCAL